MTRLVALVLAQKWSRVRVEASFTVSGTITGLSGDLSLALNGSELVTASADGNFTFSTEFADAATYEVSVLVQPAGLGCTVANGSGTIAAADITDVAVTCSSASFSVGGTVTNLAGGDLFVALNGTTFATISANGAFSFPQLLDDNGTYEVTVLSPPDHVSCTVENGSGTIAGGNVSSVTVNCDAILVTDTGDTTADDGS